MIKNTTTQKYRVKFLGFLLFLVFLAGVFFGYSHLQKHVFSEHVKIVFLQIERGDSTYIRTPHHKEILIDGGQNVSTLIALDRHRPFWDKHIDLLIMTHPDSDHYYGFIPLLQRFSVDNILMTGAKKDDPMYQKIFDIAEEKNIQILYADKTQDFIVDGVKFDILYPDYSLLGLEKSAGNNNSLVIKMSYQGPEISGKNKNKSILFTGDIEKKTEELLLSSGKNVHADILKVPHHGSKSSSSENFLSAVNPELAVFTTGTKNSFGHPHQEVLERYKSFGIEYVNSKDGDVVIEW